MNATETRPQTDPQGEQQTKQPWLWNVVLLDDDAHTVDYVVQMMQDLFGHPPERGVKIAHTVDREKRAIVLTTHREHAELKQEQVHAYGRDRLIAGCAGSMSAIIEPAYADSDASDDSSKPGA